MKNLVAKDIMNADVIVVQESMTVSELSDVLTAEMITGVPVIDDGGKLIGVVSATDIVRSSARRTAIAQENQRSNYYVRGWEEQMDEDDLAIIQHKIYLT